MKQLSDYRLPAIDYRLLLLALFVWEIPRFAYAQIEPPPDLGYDPPPGWEYVMRLDTTDIRIMAHNDSLIFQTKTTNNFFWTIKRSTNGGVTWDSTVEYPWIDGHIENTPLFQMLGKNENLQYVYDTIFRVSTDLGKTWVERARMSEFIAPGLSTGGGKFYSDLHNPYNIWFNVYSRKDLGIIDHEWVYFTIDAGYTWKLLEIPAPSNYLLAQKVRFDIKFDYREPGAWYFSSYGLYEGHDGSTDEAGQYYISRDQGKTFTQIGSTTSKYLFGNLIERQMTGLPSWGDLIGVTDTAEHFYWTGPNEYITHGYKVIDSNENVYSVELLKQIRPDKFPLDTSKGYVYSISNNDAIFYPYAPDQLMLPTAEGKSDAAFDTIYFLNYWIYFSSNQQVFNEIFSTVNLPRVSRLFFDPITGTTWLKTTDIRRTKYSSYDSGAYHQSLWKRKVFTPIKSSVETNSKSSEDLFTRIVYSRQGPPNLLVQQPKTSRTRIALYDILGHELAVIYDGVLHAGEYHFHLWETLALPARSFFIKIEEPGWYKTEKVFINKP